MRKILYSPGFGAGWTSWHHGSAEERRFMLEHRPTIDALERGETLTVDHEERFLADYMAAFPGADVPYMGGFDQLQIHESPGRVRISEYDGCERVEDEGEYEGWL